MGDLVTKAMGVVIFGVATSFSWFLVPARFENVTAFSLQVVELNCSKEKPCEVQLMTDGEKRHFLVIRSDGSKEVSFTVTTSAEEGGSKRLVLRRYDGAEMLSETEVDQNDKILEWLNAAESFDCDSSACDGCMENGQFTFGRS